MSICCLTVRKEHSSRESTKYIGMNVHKDAISIAVLNSSGKLVMESIIETKAITILEFVQALRGCPQRPEPLERNARTNPAR